MRGELKVCCSPKCLLVASSAATRILITYPEFGLGLMTGANVKVAPAYISRLNQSSSCNDRN